MWHIYEHAVVLRMTVSEHPEWEIKNGFVIFQKAKESVPCKEIPISASHQSDTQLCEGVGADSVKVKF
ncbi:unnamed protein product [Camellia sinensis]